MKASSSTSLLSVFTSSVPSGYLRVRCASISRGSQSFGMFHSARTSAMRF